MRRSTPYALTLLSLVGGLLVLLGGPLQTETLNYLVGGIFLVVALASVTYLTVAYSGPSERGPDF